MDTIGFVCSHCHTNLLVPATMAGVRGPCPVCGEEIRAPQPPQVKVVEPAPVVAAAPLRLEVERGTMPPRPRPMPVWTPAEMEPPLDPQPPRAVKRTVWLNSWLLAGMVLALGLLVIFLARPFWETRATGKISPPERAPKEAAAATVAPAADPAPAPAAALPPAATPPVAVDAESPEKLQPVVQEAARILNQFLRAKSLEERLPLMETETPVAEMKDSVLAGKLPLGERIQLQEARVKAEEGFTDALFEVDFKKGMERKPEIVLVRTRGTQAPKVLADPFLDGYGGRMARFSSGFEDGEKVFRTLVAVFDFCSSPNVPNAENKKTVKILTTRSGGDLAKAYFGKFAPLGKKLERLGMKYGRTAAVTLTLRWNREEDPARPYLEVIDVTELDWD